MLEDDPSDEEIIKRNSRLDETEQVHPEVGNVDDPAVRVRRKLNKKAQRPLLTVDEEGE